MARGWHILTMVRPEAFNPNIELGMHQGFVVAIWLECVWFYTIQVKVHVVSVVISEKYLVCLSTQCCNQWWSPDVAMDLVAMFHLSFGLAILSGGFPYCLPIFAGLALTHHFAWWVEPHAFNSTFSDHFMNCRWCNIAQAWVKFLHCEDLLTACCSSK